MKKENRQRTQQKGNKEKQTQVSEKNDEVVRVQLVEERKNKMTIAELATAIISVTALVVSILSLWNQNQYAELEYEYKLDPEVDMQGRMGATIQKYKDGSGRVTPNVSECKIEILQKNNLKSAYLIHDNYEVEQLELDEIENRLEIELKEKIEFDKPSMVINDISYHYEFVLLEGLDDSYKLVLIYVRSGKIGEELDGKFGFDALSGIEILELEKTHIGEEEYEGEKIMAEKYLEILDMCEKYIVQ